MEDAEFIHLLRRRIDWAEAQSVDTTAAQAAIDAIEALVSIPGPTGRLSAQLLPDPDALYAARVQVAEAIENLGATIGGPIIDVEGGDGLAFGEWERDEGPVARHLTISNIGTETLTVDTSITGPDAAEFTTSIVRGASPLAPGESLTVKIAWDPPTGSGGVDAELEITHDDPNATNPFVVDLAGARLPVELSVFRLE